MKYEDMMPHQQRVVDEKLELDAKIGKLDEFIERCPKFYKVGLAEMKRLCKQFDAMSEYSYILGERIAAFGKDDD